MSSPKKQSPIKKVELPKTNTKPKNSFESKIEELTNYVQQNHKVLKDIDQKIMELQQQRNQVAVLIDSQQYTIGTLTEMNKQA